MKILVECGNSSNNFGDFSMLKVCIDRLNELFPNARLVPLNHNQNDHFEAISQIRTTTGRNLWHLHRPVWTRLKNRSPHLIDTLYKLNPSVWERLSRLKMRAFGYDHETRDSFLATFDQADLLVLSGGGYVTDLFPEGAKRHLNLIHLAQTRSIPVAMLGQGLGPFENPSIVQKAENILADINLLALREGRSSTGLAHELGVPDSLTIVTGDDAVELAYEYCPTSLGRRLGVNLRLANYAGTNSDTLSTVCDALDRILETLEVEIQPVPIAHHGDDSDVKAIEQIQRHLGLNTFGVRQISSLSSLLRKISECRTVVTGSYHGGVFALSQGIPVVAISNSRYYDEKFLGLAEQFEVGCTVLRVDHPDFRSSLIDATLSSWHEADETRTTLLSNASRQINKSKEAYERLRSLV